MRRSDVRRLRQALRGLRSRRLGGTADDLDLGGDLDLRHVPGDSQEGGSELADARQKLFWFLCGWLGGPNHYIERFGHPRLRARHMPFKIGIVERDQWLACMDQAMGEVGIDEVLRGKLRESFFGTADWMRNTPG